MSAELSDSIYEQIRLFSAEGDELASRCDYSAAIKTYNKAWELVPEPKSSWDAATWLLAAIAEAAFLGGFMQSAREALDYVMHCPDAVGNPFLHLRRGQVLLEQGDQDVAADELIRAYMGGGPELFAREPAKYLDFLRTRAFLPK